MSGFWRCLANGRVGAVAVFLCVLLVCGPSRSNAEGRGLFTGRRLAGLVLLGGSAALTKKGFDYHRDADELYKLYKESEDPDEAARLYSRTTNRDVKSQMSWAVAVAFAFSSARLLLADRGESYAHRPPPAASRDGNWHLEAQIDPHRVGVFAKKAFVPQWPRRRF